MALTKYHIHEEIDGVKCSVVEKSCSKDRADFLKKLLTFNGYEVKIGAAAPAKVVAKPVNPDEPIKEAEPVVESYIVGVTDIVFNPVHALYSRLLHTPDRHVVTVAYWNQQETVSHDEVPYYQK